ncbi:hypothetical protein CTA2_2508 [Colletotrichum tanaceti]|uniref:Uncharacterized protein n=1 Tax=Colletotrichum tanaceti TaxID=1306861 RepID=A0A4U6XR37_9PEZI|nr:hypothetical protein CTA2_2508 [Colletotrichum tanaceti]TKW58353.1 hypothetical protein CTA1_5170 [Colletotrichum tanaceti]
MPILKANARPAASVRVERVIKEKKGPLQPSGSGVRKLTYNTVRGSSSSSSNKDNKSNNNNNNNTAYGANTSVPATTTSTASASLHALPLKTVKAGRVDKMARSTAKVAPKPKATKATTLKKKIATTAASIPGLVPISSFGSSASSMRAAIVPAPPSEDTALDSIEKSRASSSPPRRVAAGVPWYPTPTPTPEPAKTKTTKACLESALRAIPNLDFAGRPLTILPAVQEELVQAFGLDKSNAPPRSVEDYLVEVLRACLRRRDSYRSEARAREVGLGLGRGDRDRDLFFFSEVAFGLDSLHAADQMWAPGYELAGLRPRTIMALVDAVLAARVGCGSAGGEETELTVLLKMWSEVKKSKSL